jgi:hypothetical protein
MCPVQTVTYVSGSSSSALTEACGPAFALQIHGSDAGSEFGELLPGGEVAERAGIV